MINVDDAIVLLEQLQSRTDLCWPEPDDEGMTWFNMNLNDEDLMRACNMVEKLIIDDQGRNRYSVMVEFLNKGYTVFPGETDSFGWLTGCIKKKGGNGPILVFG